MFELPLYLCDEGYPVTYVQVRLNEDGAGLEEDGQFGPATEAAVITFQRDWGLPTTGVVDLDTWAMMFMYWGLPGYDSDGNGVITPSEIIAD